MKQLENIFKGRNVMERKQIKKVYLVDSENVADLWVTHLMKLAEPEDDIIVFYTAKSPHMGYEHIRMLLTSAHEVEFVKCAEGQNALDFQLVTELGYRLGKKKEDTEYIIVTNDTGFDAVVKYWQNRKMAVKRYNAKYCHNLVNLKETEKKELKEKKQEEGKRENVPVTIQLLQELQEEQKEEEVKIIEVSKNNLEPKEKTESVSIQKNKEKLTDNKSPNKQNTDGEKHSNMVEETKQNATEQENNETLVKDLVSCIGTKNIPDIHNALICLLGSQEGKQLYKQVKGKLNEYVPINKMQIKNRFKTYCQIVFEYSQPKEECPPNFSKFVYDAKDKRKNLNSFRSALQNEYGKEKGMNYYTIIKPHVKILNRMQDA